jgi:hypothetical protein
VGAAGVKNPNRNYAIEWILGRKGLTDAQKEAAIAAVVSTPTDATGDVFGDVSGSLLGPLNVMGLLGSPIDGPAADGDVLRYDEATDTWLPIGLSTIATDGMVPYFVASGDTFTVPEFKQALFSMLIDNEGTLAVDGFLLEVD